MNDGFRNDGSGDDGSRNDGFVDGNAAAGVLTEIFSVDVTTARGQCAGCSEVGVLAEAHTYTHAPGVVVRCRSCEEVLIRVVQAPDRTWLDLRGLAYLQLRAPQTLPDS